MKRHTHTPEEYPVFARQTQRILKDGSTVSRRIGINENLIHYVQEAALLISVIDGTVDKEGFGPGAPFDHVVYLDKSARPVSWLVNLFRNRFAAAAGEGGPVPRPPHSCVNIDRSPWFRKVGIMVSDDGRQKLGGELATFRDFMNHISRVTPRHLAELRAASKALSRDMRRLFRDCEEGRLLFVPPCAWIDCGRFEAEILRQGLKRIPEDASEGEAGRIRPDPLYFQNFLRRPTGGE